MKLEIGNEKNGTSLKITLSGNLNTQTAPKLVDQLKANTDGMTEIVIDMERLEIHIFSRIACAAWHSKSHG